RQMCIRDSLYTSIQHDYASAIRRMVISIDVPRRREVNWRVFEVAGSGGLLVTGSRGEVERLFEGARIFSYTGPILSHNLPQSTPSEIEASAREAAERVEEALSNPEAAARSVEETCRIAWERHTMHDRVCTIIRDLGYKCSPDARRIFEETRREYIERCGETGERVGTALERLAGPGQ
ncbi:MAG: glycosyltransferase, partial [Desulfurococcales archaeon]|nr:glycosyltransferase [Desulfurococcales archaeon]